MRAAGYVLAGGRSTRFGSDKALVEFNGKPLLADIADKLASVTGNVTIVGPPGRYLRLGFRVIPDLHPNRGPLAGIEAALTDGDALWTVVLSCDLFEVRVGWIRDVLHCAAVSGTQCVVCRDSTGQLHPLLAAYRKDCLPLISDALNREQLRLMDVLSSLTVAVVDLDAQLPNLNTIEDWRRYRSSRDGEASTASHTQNGR